MKGFDYATMEPEKADLLKGLASRIHSLRNGTPVPDESDGYRDKDNYARNVWLYEQRKAGKSNRTILDELSARAKDFAPLDSENALRSAIDSIANFHGWPMVKGAAGRPRSDGRRTVWTEVAAEGPRPDEVVYFIEAVGCGRVKIGKAQDAFSYIAKIQEACPFPLSLLGVVKNEHYSEEQIRGRFSRFWIMGGWFLLDDSLRQYIASNGSENE
jgi:hypothetical protein